MPTLSGRPADEHAVLQSILRFARLRFLITTPASERCWRSTNWTGFSASSTVQLRVKRGALFSLDDAKNNDLIFVGSPAENLTLLEIPGTQEFVFQRLNSGPRKGDLEVVNVHPPPGESRIFLATPSNQSMNEDYAIVSLKPGSGSRRIPC